MSQKNKKQKKKNAAEMLLKHSLASQVHFEKRPIGLTGKFSSLCDGDCGDGVCGQCN